MFSNTTDGLGRLVNRTRSRPCFPCCQNGRRRSWRPHPHPHPDSATHCDPAPRPSRARGHAPPGSLTGGRVDALIDAPPQRGRGGHRTDHPLAIGPQLTNSFRTVRAVGHCSGQVGDRIAGRMDSRPLMGVGQGRADLCRQHVRSASSRNMLTPACDTTPWPSADTFTRETAALTFT
jgi:hypothetical protein